MKKQLISEELKRLQKLAGIQLTENSDSSLNEETNKGLITFEQLKQACIENYKLGLPPDDEEYDNGLEEATNVDELVNILDGLGFNGEEAYDFIFDSIIK